MVVVLNEALTEDLVQVVERIVAVDELEIGVAALVVVREVDLDQVDLLLQPLRLVEVEQHRFLVGVPAPHLGDLGGLRTRVDDLQVQVEGVDHPLVLGRETGRPPQELALVTGLGGTEDLGVLLDPLQRGDVRVLLRHVGGHVPTDHALITGGAAVHDGVVALGAVQFVQVLVTPVLQDHVQDPLVEGLPGGLFLQPDQLDLVVHLLLEDVLQHHGAGLVTDPAVEGHAHRVGVPGELVGAHRTRAHHHQGQPHGEQPEQGLLAQQPRHGVPSFPA